MEDYNLAMFTHAMDFFKEHEFEEANFRTFFYKLVEQFVDKGFGNDWQLAINIIHQIQKKDCMQL
jgi:hypothetical protein